MPGSGPRRTVTMADVARLAGVSITTVSHVINRSRPVAGETEHAVLAAISRLGYVADNVVRSRRTAGPRTLGAAMSMMTDPYQGDLVNGLLNAATAAGYSLLLAETREDELGELRAIVDLVDKRVEAVILTPSERPDRALGYLHQREVPFVVIDRRADPRFDHVVVECVNATELLVDHLVEHGHHRIAIITGIPNLSTTQDRLQGYRNGLRKHGIRPYRRYVVEGHGDERASEVAMRTLLELDRPPTAVVSANNRMTIGALRAITHRGLTVPDDLAFVAFDDFSWADVFEPRLTVIRQPTREVGEQAIRLLLHRMANPSAPPQHVVLEPTFIRRSSCGCHQDRR